MVIVASVSGDEQPAKSGLRLINLKTDLAQLADLIELVFADSMDDSGRAAIREMRYISRMGFGLSLLHRLNSTALGISKGYVWIEDGRLVGNVSIYPARWPAGTPNAWMIANVGVHPDFQRRGIARMMMEASLDLIRKYGGDTAILQVDHDNHRALRLYESMGFFKERAFNMWWRSALAPIPPTSRDQDLFIAHRRDGDWRDEYQIARRVRPDTQGGIGWTRPLHVSYFRPSLLGTVRRLFSVMSHERLIVRHTDEEKLMASLWAESGLGLSRIKLTLLCEPQHVHPYGAALLNTILRRQSTSGFVMEHPYDDYETSTLLESYRFRADRTVWHMRLDLS